MLAVRALIIDVVSARIPVTLFDLDSIRMDDPNAAIWRVVPRV